MPSIVYPYQQRTLPYIRHIEICRTVGPGTGKNQAGPTMFSAYWFENPVKTCSLLWSGNNFLFVGPSNSVFKSLSFLQ